MKILVVDDNPDVRRLMIEMLLNIGAVPVPYEGGNRALECYRRECPDIVLMDLAMPEMDGLEATKQICSIDGEACIYIVSAYSDDMLRRAAKVAGASGYYLKDNLDPLLAKVQRRVNDGHYRRHRN